MKRVSLLAALGLVLACGAPVAAQTSGARHSAFDFAGDALARYEWTRDLPGAAPNESRWRLQLRPRLELSVGPLELGVGGQFNYAQHKNDEPPAGETTLALVRDNFRARDARLDLAYGRLKLGPVEAVGGRFVMPIPLTEMIWDQDLRPQGGALSLGFGGQAAGSSGLVLTGIYAKGSHVFDDESVMYGGAAAISLAAGSSSRLQIVGSYLQFDKLDQLQLAIRRQNTRQEGLIVNDYRVADVVARLATTGQFPLLLVADYCWNTALDAGNHGLWLATALGTLEGSRAQLVYTYAKIDKDATVAAFNADDFFWSTGWEGHRIDLGSRAARKSSIHAITQWQRFKDSPDPAVNKQWVKRWRLEWRTTF